MKLDNTKYEKIYQQHSKPSPMWKNITWAFVIGGLICTVAEAIKQGYLSMGLTEKAVATALPITMVLIGVVLTALRIYRKLAKLAGGGTLVPITGFANAIASAAVEFKSEGLILGTCVKMFTIAGPVLVCGVAASILYGLILCIMR